MNRKLVWCSFAVLSALWAGTLWVAGQLLAKLPGLLPQSIDWLGDFPLLQSLWSWGQPLLESLAAASPVMVWVLWAIGQAGLLLLVWAALRFVPDHSLDTLRLRMMRSLQQVDR